MNWPHLIEPRGIAGFAEGYGEYPARTISAIRNSDDKLIGGYQRIESSEHWERQSGQRQSSYLFLSEASVSLLSL